MLKITLLISLTMVNFSIYTMEKEQNNSKSSDEMLLGPSEILTAAFCEILSYATAPTEVGNTDGSTPSNSLREDLYLFTGPSLHSMTLDLNKFSFGEGSRNAVLLLSSSPLSQEQQAHKERTQKEKGLK